MKKKDKKLCKKAKLYLETISKNKQGNYCVSVEMDSYTELGCLLSSLIRISQESLFLKDEKLEENLRIDIYNLLNLANKLIPFSELELLDRFRK